MNRLITITILALSAATLFSCCPLRCGPGGEVERIGRREKVLRERDYYHSPTQRNRRASSRQ